MADLDLAAIKARVDACGTWDFGMSAANVLARKDVPALIAEVERQAAIIAAAIQWNVNGRPGGEYPRLLEILSESGDNQ